MCGFRANTVAIVLILLLSFDLLVLFHNSQAYGVEKRGLQKLFRGCRPCVEDHRKLRLLGLRQPFPVPAPMRHDIFQQYGKVPPRFIPNKPPTPKT